MSKKKKKESKQQKGVEYIVDGKITKSVETAIVNFSEEYDRKIRTMQIIALISVMIITLISPLRLIDSDIAFDETYVYVTIGFIVAGIIPSIIAIFNFMKRRKFCLYLSVLIYGTWIFVLSTFFWEIIVLMSILIIYYEITNTLLKVEPMLKDVVSIAKSGAYYHANVFLGRYMRFLLRYTGSLLGISLVVGIFGRYVLTLIQGDILFSIFMILALIIILIITRKTLTLDMQKLIVKESHKKREEELAHSHSKFS